jgi:hypothetical protein
VLERLTKLDAALVIDHSLGQFVFMVYEIQGGYNGAPRGKRYPLRIRPAEELVTLREIDAMLRHLGFSATEFWNFEHQVSDAPVQPPLLAVNPKLAAILHDVELSLCPECHRPLELVEIPQRICAKCATVN